MATLHFAQVWPLVPEQFLERIASGPRGGCVEGNATGQLARLIRRETGFRVERRVLRYDGLPITPEFILARSWNDNERDNRMVTLEDYGDV